MSVVDKDPFCVGVVSDARGASRMNLVATSPAKSVSSQEAADRICQRPHGDFGLEDLPEDLLHLGKPNDGVYSISKRAIDVLGGMLGLLLSAPILLVVAILVRLSGAGPIIYKHKRLGLHGETFWCYKFRSMISDADRVLERDPELRKQFQENFKLDHDPRITPLGAFLRKTSLDELPQFFNVLRGDMTLIGPRPIVPAEIEKYGGYGPKLLSVRPGLSGFWQAYGRSDTSYHERVAMDMHYIDNKSLWMDLKLMAMTLIAVLRKDGAK